MKTKSIKHFSIIIYPIWEILIAAKDMKNCGIKRGNLVVDFYRQRLDLILPAEMIFYYLTDGYDFVLQKLSLEFRREM